MIDSREPADLDADRDDCPWCDTDCAGRCGDEIEARVPTTVLSRSHLENARVRK